jgi:hypothetical protein
VADAQPLAAWKSGKVVKREKTLRVRSKTTEEG